MKKADKANFKSRLGIIDVKPLKAGRCSSFLLKKVIHFDWSTRFRCSLFTNQTLIRCRYFESKNYFFFTWNQNQISTGISGHPFIDVRELYAVLMHIIPWAKMQEKLFPNMRTSYIVVKEI